MKTTRIVALLFIAMVILETFYPLGDIVHKYFGSFGDFVGEVFCMAGIIYVGIQTHNFTKSRGWFKDPEDKDFKL